MEHVIQLAKAYPLVLSGTTQGWELTPVLLRLLLRGLRYGSRFPQGAPQELQHGIVSPPEVKFDDFLPG